MRIQVQQLSQGFSCYFESVIRILLNQLDAKYKLFNKKKIILYSNRGHIKMFTEPIRLDNWLIKI